MREVSRNGKTYVVAGDTEFEYDGVVKIYIDSATGNWVVNTNLTSESVADVLSDAQDHFVEMIEDEPVVETESPTIGGIGVYPLKNPGYN